MERSKADCDIGFMNPTVWGPSLWKIMTDVAVKADRVQDVRVLPYVTNFYTSLAFLLPCVHCRRSYRQFIRLIDLGDYLKQRNVVQWIWTLKERVNDKLGKPPQQRLDLAMFQRRINLYTHCAHAEDMLDFMSLLGLNYEPNEPLKKKHMLIFHAVLPVVLPYTNLNALLLKKPLRADDVVSRESYLNWLYQIRSQFVKMCQLPSLPPPATLWRRYENARAANREPIPCDYVLDDPSTWSAEHATLCQQQQQKASTGRSAKSQRPG